MKAQKLMKLHFKKYELVKSLENIVLAPKEGKPDEKIAQMCDTFVKELQDEKGIGCKKYNEPHIIIIVPDVE